MICLVGQKKEGGLGCEFLGAEAGAAVAEKKPAEIPRNVNAEFISADCPALVVEMADSDGFAELACGRGGERVLESADVSQLEGDDIELVLFRVPPGFDPALLEELRPRGTDPSEAPQILGLGLVARRWGDSLSVGPLPPCQPPSRGRPSAIRSACGARQSLARRCVTSTPRAATDSSGPAPVTGTLERTQLQRRLSQMAAQNCSVPSTTNLRQR